MAARSICSVEKINTPKCHLPWRICLCALVSIPLSNGDDRVETWSCFIVIFWCFDVITELWRGNGDYELLLGNRSSEVLRIGLIDTRPVSFSWIFPYLLNFLLDLNYTLKIDLSRAGCESIHDIHLSRNGTRIDRTTLVGGVFWVGIAKLPPCYISTAENW